MSRPPFPTPYAGAYYPIYGHEKNEYLEPTDSTPFDKVSALFFAFAHAYPLLMKDPGGDMRHGALLDFERGHPDEPDRVRKVMDFARRKNPGILFIISLGWAHNDWTYINGDYASGRNNFPASVVSFVREHGLDGFDIDDESIGVVSDDGKCHALSGCISQENFNGVIANIRAGLDEASRADGRPYYFTITPAFGTQHVTKENHAQFDLINPQSYAAGTGTELFTALGAAKKQISWGIDTEKATVRYPSPKDYQDLAGIFNWSMSADSHRETAFEYTNRIARDVGYPPG